MVVPSSQPPSYLLSPQQPPPAYSLLMRCQGSYGALYGHGHGVESGISRLITGHDCCCCHGVLSCCC